MKGKEAISRLRSVLRRYARAFLTTFGLIMVALAASLSLVYASFQSIVLDSVAKQHSEFVGQLNSLSDMLSATIQNYGMQVFYAPTVLELREGTGLDKLSQVYALRELGSYISSNDHVDSIQVYDRDSGYIYSTDSNVSSDSLELYADRDAARIFSQLSPDMRMHPMSRTAFPGDPVRQRQYFSFLFFETTPEDEPTGGALMLNVDRERYLDMLLSFDYEGDCVLLDQDMELLTARGENAKTEMEEFLPQISSQNKSGGYLLKKIAGEQTVCLYSPLSSSNWLYLKILPLNECVPRLMELKAQLTVGILLGFAILAVSSLAVLIFLYFPVHQVRSVLERLGSDRNAELVGQVSDLARRSQEYQRANTLQALLEGRETKMPAGLPPPYTLILLETDQPKQVQTWLTEVQPRTLSYNNNGCLAVLLSGLDSEQAESLGMALTHSGASCCYCSKPRPAADELSRCYQELCQLRSLHFWTPEKSFVIEEEKPKAKAHSSFTETEAASLSSVLRSGDMEQAKTAWEEIKDKLRRDSYQEQIFAFRRVAAILEKQLPSLKPLIEEDFWSGLRDIAQLDGKILSAFDEIFRHEQQQHKLRIDQLADKVQRRIDEGCADPDLSPTRIADEMGMSGAYLGRIFKESRGQSISQYINQTRVRQAARLLRTDQEPVERIAAAVGFSNVKYFYVVFKNTTGQTPLQYRKSCREDLSDSQKIQESLP